MKKCFTLLLLLGAMGTCYGQDPFFSQFYNSPLTLNPALTGVSWGNIRLAANYRNYLTTLTPITSYSVSADASLLENNPNGDFAGVGMVLLNDNAGAGLSSLKGGLTFAYHKGLGFGNSSKWRMKSCLRMSRLKVEMI